MEPQAFYNEIMDFFKALSNADRLKIAGAIALKPFTLDALINYVQLRPKEVVRHLEYLSHIGLVQIKDNSYRLDTDALEALSRKVLEFQRPSVKPEDFEGEAYDRKVLRDFISPDGRLKSLPSQQKKLQVILRHVVSFFEPNKQYTEKEVNERISRFYPDTASLRRYLVDTGLMKREKGEYWRSETE